MKFRKHVLSSQSSSKVTIPFKAQPFYSSFGHVSESQTSSALHNIKMARKSKERKTAVRF